MPLKANDKFFYKEVIMCRIGYCPICKTENIALTRHHKWRTHVWKDKKKQKKKILICRSCHDKLEKEITRREGVILRQYPEIYIGTLDEFLTGKFPVGDQNDSHY
jgi:transcription elongation factor Elf1